MKQITIIRYTGSKHITLVADVKSNPILVSPLQATATSNEEAEELLKADLSLQIEGEFELAMKDYNFAKKTTEDLLKYYERTEKMLGAHEAIETILIKRGALSINNEEPQDPEEEAPTTEKTPREYKKCMTEDCLQARLAEARKNYKKFCKFYCTKDKEEHFGIIRSARLDKRSGFIQYRIEIIERPTENDTIYTELTGRIYGKGDDSKSLTIFDTKPEEIQLPEPAPKEETYTKEDAEKMNETVAKA